MGFWRFFWACVQAAEEKTAGYFGWDLKTMLTALALAVIGYILYLRVHGRHKTKERLGEDLLLTVVPLYVPQRSPKSGHVRSPENRP